MSGTLKFGWVLASLEGTLADMRPYLFEAYCDFLQAHGAAGTPEEFGMLNGSPRDQVALLRDAHRLTGILAVLEREYHDRLQDAYARARPYPDAEPLLRHLATRGCTLVLATSAPKECAHEFLRSHRWESLFKCVVSGSEAGQGSPSPNLYHHASGSLGIDLKSAIVLDASLSGIQSAVNAGFAFLRVDHRETPLARVAALLEGSASPGLTDLCEVVASGSLRVIHRPEELSLTATQTDRVDVVWREEQRKNPTLFNGSLLSYRGLRESAGVTEIEGTLVEYKRFLAQLRDPTLVLGIAPIAVSGLTVLQDNGIPYVLFALREDSVTEYPGRLELPPSGSLDLSVVAPDGTVRFEEKLREEFVEELGLAAETIESIRSLCLILDRTHQVYDLCALIRARASRDQLLAALRSTSEYRKVVFVPWADLRSFVERHSHAMVPTSRALVRTLDRIGALTAPP